MDKPWMKQYDGDIENRLEFFKGSAYEQLKKKASEVPGNYALNLFSYTLTFKELITKIDKTADLLWQEGFRKGDNILICIPNIPAFFFLFYAANKLGLIVTVLNYQSTYAMINSVIRECSCKGLVINQSKLPRLDDALRDTEISLVLVCNDGDYVNFIDRFNLYFSTPPELRGKRQELPKFKNRKIVSWVQFYGQEISCKVPTGTVEGKDPAFFLNSGSATGEHMIEVFTNENITSAVSIVSLGLALDKNDNNDKSSLSAVNNNYSMVLTISFHSMLCLGIEVILMPYYNPGNFAGVLFYRKPSILFGYPSMYINLMEKIETTSAYMRKSMAFLDTAISMGDSFPIGERKKFDVFLDKHNCGVEMQEAYGLTECLSVCSLTPLFKARDNSMGIPLPGVLMKIVDPNTMVELPSGRQGEICVCSPTSMAYVNNDQSATDSILRKHRDGRTWIHTGDIGHMDDDGYFYFDYMKKRCANIGGRSVSLKAVEDTVKNVYGVEDVCVIDQADENGNTILVALVVPNDRFLFDNDKLVQLKDSIEMECNMLLLEYQRPSKIEYRASLPKNGVGETDYKQVVAEMAEQH